MSLENGSTTAMPIQSHVHAQLTSLDRALNTSVLCLVIVVAILGNSIALLAFWISPELKRATNYFIVLLCISDVTVAVLVMPLWVSYVKTGYPDYMLDKAVYNLYLFFDILCSTSSIASLAMISVERYLSIAHPMRYDRLMTHTVTCGALVMAVFYSILTATLGQIQRIIGDEKYVPLGIFGLAYVIPITVKVLAYGQIYKTAKIQLHKIERMRHVYRQRTMEDEPSTLDRKPDSEASHIVTPNTDNELDPLHGSRQTTDVEQRKLFDSHTQQHDRGAGTEVTRQLSAKKVQLPRTESHRTFLSKHNRLRRTTSSFSGVKQRSLAKVRRFRRDLRAAKVLGLIIGTFVVLWTPFMVVVLISSQKPGWVTLRLIVITKDLHYLNSAINPILYVLLNREFRRGVKRVIRRIKVLCARR